MNVNNISRLEVIDYNNDGTDNKFPRELVKYFEAGKLEAQIQDDGRTLKLFISKKD